MLSILTPEEAWERIAQECAPLAAKVIGRDQALGRRLTETISATTDVPQADVSAMDGYACDGQLPTNTPIAVVGTVAAGQLADFQLQPGECAKIMTGAVLPPGTDRIVPIELSDGGKQRVRFQTMTAANAHIRRQGEVVRPGELLLAEGSLLTPGGLALLASQGIQRLKATRQPRVSVLATGDEVVPDTAVPQPGQLRNSNSPFLLAAGRSMGLAFHPLGIASDDRNALRQDISRGLESDVLLLTGGVSMGDFDHAEEIFAELGCRCLFDKVAMQPGKPLVVARYGDRQDGTWVFGLPGNPASVMVTFWLFVRPLLRRLQGFDDGFWVGAQQGVLTSPLPAGKARDRFLPARVTVRQGALLVQPQNSAGSHDVSAYAHGTALLRIRRAAAKAEAGDPCEVLPLNSWP
jgi:molybdopterin molybdotransferase